VLRVGKPLRTKELSVLVTWKCFERLVFGDDIDMDMVVEFSEEVVVDRVRGKNSVWPS
jgi:hypothetical protein